MNWEVTTMALRNGLFTLALSALLFAPVAARAADPSWAPQHGASPVVGQGVPAQGWHQAPPPPRPPSRGNDRAGRYELQTVYTSVPGHSERIWVAEQCADSPRHRRTCEPAHYERQWVPAHTQPSQQWVWVPYARSPYGRG